MKCTKTTPLQTVVPLAEAPVSCLSVRLSVCFQWAPGAAHTEAPRAWCGRSVAEGISGMLASSRPASLLADKTDTKELRSLSEGGISLVEEDSREAATEVKQRERDMSLLVGRTPDRGQDFSVESAEHVLKSKRIVFPCSSCQLGPKHAYPPT